MTLYRLFPILIFVVLWGCQPAKLVHKTDSLTQKSEPYDHFTFQRSYPDTIFDWVAWRRIMQSISPSNATAERSLDPCTNTVASTTNWTLQGPSNIAGRVNTLAVKPNDENTILAGFAGGGIFKSTDAGVNWTPVFDAFVQLSIGAIHFDPSQPNVVYAGTGDVNMPSILYNGDGVYKSTNAGDSWQYLGLKNAGIIAEIVVHPTNSQVIWVATMGNPYQRTNERGVYKTTDGGQSWQKVLFVSNQAGCSGLVLSAANPQILYASFWDRIRNNSESIVYGPNAKVFKSTDGGSTWTQLGGGLPTGTNGRTGLAISQQNPDKVYALFIDSLSTPGSLHLTTDGGQTWSPLSITSLEDACGDFGWYFGKITLHPTNDNDLYFHGILLQRRLANGQWVVASGGHSDSHDLVFCPSGRRYWANDGGVYRNEVNTMTWTKSKNLPANQVYRTSYNPLKPTEYWLGSQDNGIKKGNALSINNWADIFSADGFNCAFHPSSTDTFWVETQNGNISQTNNNGGNWASTGTAYGSLDRVNWDAPFFRSQFPPHRFYGGTYRLMVSPDGLSFGPNSGDLTDGVILAPRFHTISYVSESPITEGKLFVGTSDANVWRRENNGTWFNITAGLPTRYVTSVIGSPTQNNRVFVTHSGFRDGEYVPHVHRSDNNGLNWVDITGDLPPVPVNQIFVVPGMADEVLALATDAGVYASKNGGTNWYRLGQGLPAMPVFDFKHNVVQKQLVAATFGRGIWTFPIDSIESVQPTAPATVAASGMIENQAGGGVGKVRFPDLDSASVSNSTGHYLLPALQGCREIIFKPYRNDNPTNGVTVYDLVLMSRHILNLEPITSPYNLIAGDANKSGTVTTFDIVLLRKLILGTDSVFSNNTAWRFVKSDFQFTNNNNPFADTFPEQVKVILEQAPVSVPSFKGLKVGDIDNTASSNFNADLEDRSLPEWPLLLSNASLTPGTTIEIPIQLNMSQLAGIQLALNFDPTVLEWLPPTNLAEGFELAEHLNMGRVGDGLVNLAFEPDGRLNGLNTLLQLQFKVRKSGELSQVIRISDAITPALIFDQSGQASRPVINWGGKDQASDFLIFPNPAPAKTGCWVLAPANTSIIVWDMHGKQQWKGMATANTPMEIKGLIPGIYTVDCAGIGVKKWVVTE